MIHVQTGNNVDVIVDYEEGKQSITGLNVKTADGRVFIPLKDPEGLLSVLSRLMDECKVANDTEVIVTINEGLNGKMPTHF